MVNKHIIVTLFVTAAAAQRSKQILCTCFLCHGKGICKTVTIGGEIIKIGKNDRVFPIRFRVKNSRIYIIHKITPFKGCSILF